MRVLVTGIAGFVGRHLAAYLLEQTDAEVFGIARAAPRLEDERWARLGRNARRLRLLSADLRDRAAVEAALREARPDHVYHLAARSSVAESLRDPIGTISNNVTVQINLLEAVRALQTRSATGGTVGPRVLVVGSNEEYGFVRPDQLPIREETPFQPTNPYGVSKVAQELLGYQYFKAYGLDVVRVRPFVHIGPGQDDRFVAASFARQIAEIEAGLRPPVVRVGNLETQRDFTDVRDIVRGYHLALLKCNSGEAYNLGSQRPTPVRALLDGLLELTRTPVRVETDPDRLRPAEMPVQYCDCTKFEAITGWKPKIPLQQTLADILADWRQRVAERND